MAAATWPSGLPQIPLQDGFNEKEGKATIDTPMDAGPPKSRRRFTAAPMPVEMQFLMTKEQKLLFQTFYRDTIASGSLRFNFTDPTEEELYEYRIVEPPEYTAAGPQWYVRCKMLRLV